MLDRVVANLAFDEELFDVGGEAMLVDVEGLVAKIRADRREPNHDGKYRQRGETGGESITSDQAAPVMCDRRPER